MRTINLKIWFTYLMSVLKGDDLTQQRSAWSER